MATKEETGKSESVADSRDPAQLDLFGETVRVVVWVGPTITLTEDDFYYGNGPIGRFER